MLRIRMMRFGRKRQPSYRVVVLPSGTKSGRSKYVESLGWVDPLQKKHEINIDRAKYWLGVGAQPSDTVWNLFVSDGIVEGSKRKKGKAGITKEKEEAPTEKSGTSGDDSASKEVSSDTEKNEEQANNEEKKEEAAPKQEENDSSTDEKDGETDKS